MARVKTTTGELLRPLQRLYPLEVSSEEETDIFIPVKKNQIAEVSVPVPIQTSKSGRVLKNTVRYSP